MSVIIRSDNKSEVLLHTFLEPELNPAGKVTISFHKKIHGAISLSDERALSRIMSAKEEISELIY